MEETPQNTEEAENEQETAGKDAKKVKAKTFDRPKKKKVCMSDEEEFYYQLGQADREPMLKLIQDFSKKRDTLGWITQQENRTTRSAFKPPVRMNLKALNFPPTLRSINQSTPEEIVLDIQRRVAEDVHEKNRLVTMWVAEEREKLGTDHQTLEEVKERVKSKALSYITCFFGLKILYADVQIECAPRKMTSIPENHAPVRVRFKVDVTEIPSEPELQTAPEVLGKGKSKKKATKVEKSAERYQLSWKVFNEATKPHSDHCECGCLSSSYPSSEGIYPSTSSGPSEEHRDATRLSPKMTLEDLQNAFTIIIDRFFDSLPKKGRQEANSLLHYAQANPDVLEGLHDAINKAKEMVVCCLIEDVYELASKVP